MKQLSTALLFAATSLTAGAQTITNSGFAWTPEVLTVTAGTEITFVVNSNHHAREVSEATWNANGTTSNGGFDFLNGTHQLTLTVPGTYYYVCVPHVASFGMKGRIVVEANTGVNENDIVPVFTLSPNPANDMLTVTANPATAAYLTLVDVSGREVLRHKVQGNDRVDVSSLPEGNYTAVLVDAQGTLREQKRLSIAH